MVATTCQHLIAPSTLPRAAAGLSIMSYNVLLPNSQDGWWNYKMYLPPLSPEEEYISTWEYRRSLLQDRIGLVDPDVICLQEVSPLTFEEDFSFMAENLGYDGVELFRKGRFRPATFWKKSRVELVSPAQHKDRTMLTTFRLVDSNGNKQYAQKSNDLLSCDNWHVLNCHLQAGKQGGRRVRQIVEGNIIVSTLNEPYYQIPTVCNESYTGVTSAFKLAKKMKEKDPADLNLIVCGDFNGGQECGAVQYLEKGVIGPDFLEDGEPVSSKEKILPLCAPLMDVACVDGLNRGVPPSTLVVSELISLMIDGGNIEECFMDPKFSEDVIGKLKNIYEKFATVSSTEGSMQMGKADVERWLTTINGRVGRGSEFRSAAKLMGWVEPAIESEASGSESNNPESASDKKSERPPIVIPEDGILTLNDFISVYLDELFQGKFWGIAWDLATLGEPLAVDKVFTARYDRMYYSKTLAPVAVLDFDSKIPCPNKSEPSDHLPVAATFMKL